MRGIGKIVRIILLLLNAIMAVALLMSAYSGYINPEVSPYLSLIGLLFMFLAALNICWIFFWLIFKWKYLFVSLIALLLCWGALRDYCPINLHGQVPKDVIKIVSYNVASLGYDYRNNRLNGKTQTMVDYLKTTNADIICFQEAPAPEKVRKEIEKQMSGYRFTQWSPVKQNHFACISKYPILAHEILKVTHSASDPAILYKIKVDDDTINIINCHLQSNALSMDDRLYYKKTVKNADLGGIKNDTALNVLRKLATAGRLRAAQVNALDSIIGKRSFKKLIVCGDMNDTPVSYTHRVLSKRLKDAHTESGRGIDYSFNQNYLYFKIDHIFISDCLKSYNCEVDRSISTSDHYPIKCLVTINEQ